VTPGDLPPKMGARITVDPESGCWLGSAPHDKDGYARFGSGSLHRAVWLELRGPIGPKLVLDHREDWNCTSKACCFPGHLLPVTVRVNVLRGSSFAAVNAAKDTCDNGHEFDLFNTYWRPNGHRDCRACIRARVAKYQGRIRTQRVQLARAA
jgi:hypothetical protein